MGKLRLAAQDKIKEGVLNIDDKNILSLLKSSLSSSIPEVKIKNSFTAIKNATKEEAERLVKKREAEDRNWKNRNIIGDAYLGQSRGEFEELKNQSLLDPVSLLNRVEKIKQLSSDEKKREKRRSALSNEYERIFKGIDKIDNTDPIKYSNPFKENNPRWPIFIRRV